MEYLRDSQQGHLCLNHQKSREGRSKKPGPSCGPGSEGIGRPSFGDTLSTPNPTNLKGGGMGGGGDLLHQ